MTGNRLEEPQDPQEPIFVGHAEPPTQTFAWSDLAALVLCAEDPDEQPGWIDTVLSEAQYEGSGYVEVVRTSNDTCALLVPRIDTRRWERAAAANGCYVTLDPDASTWLTRFAGGSPSLRRLQANLGVIDGRIQ